MTTANLNITLFYIIDFLYPLAHYDALGLISENRALFEFLA
jgi:hypothetical protein